MTKGIIYYSTNTKCIERMLVSIYTLRKFESCPITIISEGEESNQFSHYIANGFENVTVVEADFGVEEGKNKPYMEKCLCHLYSPYDITIFIDADTLIIKEFADELFNLTETNEFGMTKFSNWTTKTKAIRKRIEAWESLYPEEVKGALECEFAINGGVFSFTRDSKFSNDWYGLAELGRFNFIPDETCMQVFYHKYKHILLDQKFNRSCKYDDVKKEDTRIIHFHGNKHCRLDDNGELMFSGELWVKEYDEVVSKNIANNNSWRQLGDRTLRSFLKKRN